MAGVFRLVRRVLARPALIALILAALVWYAMSMVVVHRLPGRYHALGFGAGVVLFSVSLLILVRRLMAARPPAWLRPLGDHWESFTCLVVLNLIIVNVLAPYLRILSRLRVRNLVVQKALAMAGEVTSQLLVALFLGGVVAIACVVVIRLYDGTARRLAPLASGGRLLERAAVAAVGGYCLYAILLTYNGGLDRSPAREHDSEVLASYEIEWPFGFPWLWFADLRSWRTPGATERALIFPARDDLTAGQVGAGQPVRVAVRAGFLGIPRIDRIRRDPDRHLAALVDDVPGARRARLRLTERLAAEGRWGEVIAHVTAHLRHYPDDPEYYWTAVTLARRAGRVDEADRIRSVIERVHSALGAAKARTAGATAAHARGAGAVTAGAQALAAEVMELSGLKRDVTWISREAAAVYGRWQGYVRERQRVGAGINAAYRTEALVETAARLVADRLDEPEAREAVSWLRSPLSRRLLAIEAEADSPSRQEEARAFVTALPGTELNPERLALLGRLGRAGGVTYLRIGLVEGLERGVRDAVWPFLSPVGRQWAQDEPTLEQRLARVEWTAFETMVALLTTYVPLSDAELAEIVRFAESPPGNWLGGVYGDAMLHAVQAAGSRARASLNPDRSPR